MRKFTREHNDVCWLFPSPCYSGYDIGYSNRQFSMYETMAQRLLTECYGASAVFDKDDMMDSFMKGASCGQQCTTCEAFVETRRNRMLKSTANILQNFLDKARESANGVSADWISEIDDILKTEFEIV